MDIVIVTYNSSAAVRGCLQSLGRLKEAHVIAIDNASQDGTAEAIREFPEVTLIANPCNRGFAEAANQGFRAGTSRHVLLLNPDTQLLSPDLDAVKQACEEHGLATGLLVDAEDQPQQGFFARSLPTASTLCFETLGLNRLFPRNPVNRRYRCLDLPSDKGAFVEQPPGAFLMVRRDVWEALGGLDGTFYPVWFEDTDFCKRALDRGYRIRFVPECRVRHEGGHSVTRLDEAVRAVSWYGSLLKYAAKHFRSDRFWMVCAAVAIGAVGRALVGCFQAGFRPSAWRKTVRMYATIVRLALLPSRAALGV